MNDPNLTRLRLLEDALRAIGINPDADPLVTAKRWTVERDADRRERSKAEAGAAALQERLDGLKSDRHEETLRSADEREALRAEVKRITDAHAVVSQRLVGSQKEVAEVSAERDRERAAAEYAQGLLDAVWSAVGWPEDPYVLDGVPHVQRVVRERDEATARADKATAQAKEMRVSFAEFERRGEQIARDDELREQIAVAVGLDGSASLALILDTVTRDRPVREISRLAGLLDVLAAPVTFGERRLSTAERAEWALRRALRERDECAPRMAQLIDAEVCLDTLGVPAYAAIPGDEPGDASEALTVAERLRLHFGASS